MPTKVEQKKLPKYLQYINNASKFGVTCLRSITSYTDKDGKKYTYVPFTRFRSDIQDLLNHANRPVNYFITLNGLTKRKHHGKWSYQAAKENVSYLRALWLDIDLKRWVPDITDDEATRKRVIKQFLYILPTLMKEAGLMKPTGVDISGYGVHLIYVLDNPIYLSSKLHEVNEPDKHKKESWRTTFISMWDKAMKGMAHRLNQACINDVLYQECSLDDSGATEIYKHQKPLVVRGLADYQAVSISKIMRLPGTWNCKYRHKVRCKNIENNSVHYSLGELYSEYGQKQPYKTYLKYHHKAMASRKKYRLRGQKWAKENESKDKKRINTYGRNKQGKKSRKIPRKKLLNIHIQLNHYGRANTVNARRYQGFMAHIKDKNYSIYNKVELAMFFYTALVRRIVSQKMTLKYLRKFTFNVAVPKAHRQGEHLPDSKVDTMLKRLDDEMTHFKDNDYMTLNKKIMIKKFNAEFYEPSNARICKLMKFKGKLYSSKKDERRAKKSANKKQREKRNQAIRKAHRYQHLSVRKLMKVFKLSKTSIKKILKESRKTNNINEGQKRTAVSKGFARHHKHYTR